MKMLTGIALDDLTVAYDRRPVVHHLTGCFRPGSLTAIVGPNGAGKSTMLKAIAGVLRPASGHIDRGGLDLRDLGYLPQAAEIDCTFPLNVADTIVLGAWRSIGAFGGAQRQNELVPVFPRSGSKGTSDGRWVLPNGQRSMTAFDVLVRPFLEYGFMRRALVACLALSLGSGPIGVFLLLRRMSLVGGAMGHAVLPGAADGFLIAGLSLPLMGLGGLVAGLAVALLSGVVSRTTVLREDASFAGFYLASLAIGVSIVSARGSNIDLLHVLFGTILAINDWALYLMGAIASLTVITLASVYRPLVAECFDPAFLRVVDGHGSVYHLLFMFLVALNLIAGFEVLGTLMAVGLLILPAASARLWATTLPALLAAAMAVGCASGLIGLIASYQYGVASGPAIVLTASLFYAGSILLGRGGILRRHCSCR